MRILLIYNPAAGDDGVDPGEIVPLVEAAGHEAETKSVKDGDCETAVTDDFELVVVAGGDGTVAKVFTVLAGTGTLVTLFPAGSANNIARTLGFGERNPGPLIGGWPQGRRVPFDVGGIEAGERERFAESAGGGIFAGVLARAADSPADPRGGAKIDLGLRLLRDVVAETPARTWGIHADGDELSGDILAVEAMNVRELGPNVPIAPAADPGDGLLDLTLIREADRSMLIEYLDARLGSDTHEPPPFESRRARVVVLEPPREGELHFDDDLLDGAPEEVTLGPRFRLQVLVPQMIRSEVGARTTRA